MRKGLLLSFLLHLLLYLLFWYYNKHIKPFSPQASYKTIQLSLKEVNAEPPKPSMASAPTPTKQTKQASKPTSKQIAQKATAIQKNITKKDSPLKKKRVNNKYKDPLASMLMGASPSKKSKPEQSIQARSHSPYTNNVINTLYGKGYKKLSRPEQKFIENRLDDIFRVTQVVLTRKGYPEVSIQTRQEGRNAVSFYLHPNGNISKLRLVHGTGYKALDKNSVEVIKIAFKDFPYPTTKTKIMLYINYIYD